MYRVLAIALALGAGLCGIADAQRLEATVSVDSARVGERFLLTVSVLHGSMEAPEFPSPGSGKESFGDLDGIRVVSSGRAILGPSVRLDSVVYDVTTFALDSAVVPPLSVTLNGGSRQDSTRRIVIPVISVVPADADTIHGMAEAVHFLQPGSSGTPPWPWVLLALAAFFVIGSLWWWYTRRRTEVILDDAPQDPQLSPYELAMARLGELEKVNVSAEGSEVPFFVELSEVLRMYLELRIGVPALELATNEILEEFTLVRFKIPGGVPDEVQRVLGLSDLVKFAEYVPPVADSVQSLAQTRHIIERMEDKQRQLALDAARQKEIQE